MKQFNLWFILALIAVLAMTCASQLQPTDHTTYTVLTDTQPEHDTIKLEDILLYTDRDGIMYFDTNKTKHLHGFTGDSIVHYYGYLFDIGEHNELKFLRKITIDYEYAGKITTYFYSLYHKGYFCERVAANFEAKDNQLFSASLSNYQLDIDTVVTTNKNEAIETVVEYYRPMTSSNFQFLWESPYKEQIKNLFALRGDTIEPSLYPATAILEMRPLKGKLQLAYKVPISFYPKMEGYNVFVHPKTKEILDIHRIGHYCNGNNDKFNGF